MILAAVTINAAFNSGIIDTAVNGAVNYADAQNKEQVTFDDLDKNIQDIIKRIESYDIGGGSNPAPTNPSETTNPPTAEPTPNLPAIGETPPEEGWTVEEAKGLVKRDGLKAHLGEKVAYTPEGGGTWRIFYYDNEDQGNGKGYFGDDVGTVYLKRDYDETFTRSLSLYSDYTPTDSGTILRQLNPMMGRLKEDITLPNEHVSAWLCDPHVWYDFKVEGVAKYATGSPSAEMLRESYNAYYGPNDFMHVTYSIANQYASFMHNTDKEFKNGPYEIYRVLKSFTGVVLASPALNDNSSNYLLRYLLWGCNGSFVSR